LFEIKTLILENEKVSKRASAQKSEQAHKNAKKRTSDQAIKRSSDQAIKRSSDQASKRTSKQANSSMTVIYIVIRATYFFYLAKSWQKSVDLPCHVDALHAW